MASLQANADAKRFMAEAERMRQKAVASGDQSYGAVVVKDGKIIGFGPSKVIVNGDPTAHAEMEAIRSASRTLKSQDLSGCKMFSTSRPCPMCEAAAYWANLDALVYGSELTDGGAPEYRRR